MPEFLVIQLARFGDLVQTRRLVKSLERRGRVHICADRGLLPLAGLLYPGATLHGCAAHGGAEGENPSLNHAVFKRLAAERFEAVYNLNHSGLSRALARLFPPEITHGHYVEKGQELRSPWMNTGFALAALRPLSPLNLADFWAFLLPDPLPAGEVNPPASPGGQGIGVVLSGREARRSLPPHTLAPCVRAAFERLGGPEIRLFGTDAEAPAARALVRAFSASMQARTRNLCGKTGWAELADAMSGLDCLLSPDTGSMHLAAHLGVPVRAFFLSSAWCFETGPYGLGHTVWQAVAPCLPCLESSPCGFDLQCLPPFAQPGLLAALAGSLGADTRPGKALPPGLLQLESAVDELGLCWRTQAGDDERAPQRNALRALLAEQLGLAPCRGGQTEAAALLYREKDWMLTRLNPASGRREYA